MSTTLPLDPNGRHRPLRRASSLAPTRPVRHPSVAVLYATLIPISAALGAALVKSGLL